jgi:hypothetical protein
MRQARESRDGLTLRYRFRPGPVLLPAEVVTPEIVAYVQTKIAQNKRGTPQ